MLPVHVKILRDRLIRLHLVVDVQRFGLRIISLPRPHVLLVVPIQDPHEVILEVRDVVPDDNPLIFPHVLFAVVVVVVGVAGRVSRLFQRLLECAIREQHEEKQNQHFEHLKKYEKCF